MKNTRNISALLVITLCSIIFFVAPVPATNAAEAGEPVPSEVVFTADFPDFLKWQSEGIKAQLQGNTCRLLVDNPKASYGRIDSPLIKADVDRFPFLTVSIRNNSSEEGGWTLAVNNITPLTVKQYTNETGAVTFDLREKTGWKGTQEFFLSMYLVGKNKSIDVNWIKIAGQPMKEFYVLKGADASRGYVVYPRAPFEVLTYDALPREEETGKPMSVFACPGQYEPATFLIYTAKDLQAVEITADRLRDKNNRSIPASNIDIRVMQVWYQGGEGQAFSRTVLVPELLLKDDGLIDIDTVNSRNVFNFQGLPADGPDLKPVNIPAGTSKQFWLTVKVPDNAVPGTYTSRIKVKPANTPASEIELQLEVLPINLLQPDKLYGLYYYSPSHYFYHSREDTDGLLKELKDMRAHGMNSASIFAYDTEFKVMDDGQWEINLDRLKTQIELRIQAGLTGPIIIQFLTHKPPFPVKLFRGPYAKDNAPDPEDVKKLTFIIQTMEEFIRKNNYPQLYYYGVDEPLGEDQIQRCTIIFDIIQKAGGKTVTAVFHPFLAGPDKTGRLLDMANYATTTPDSLFMNPGSEKYHNLEIHYWHPLENPNVDRLRFGLLTWKAGLDGAYPYAYRHVYQGNPYHDESTGKAAASGERNSMYTYPSQTGPIPTIQWEASRAGIDDVRYLTTLRCWAGRAEGKKDVPAVQEQREKALLLLNNLPDAFSNTPFALYRSLTPQDFSNYRKQVADQIINLQDAMKEKEGGE